MLEMEGDIRIVSIRVPMMDQSRLRARSPEL